jgi:ribosomal protein S21
VVESKRKKEESFESFLRRFNKRLQQSGNLRKVRKMQYFKETKSRNLQKRSALISLDYKDKNEYLRKIGKLKDESRNRW